jgi:hypothetical protein
MLETIPPDLVLKDISARFNQNSIPRELSVFSQIPSDQWARVVVSEGEIFILFRGEDKARCLVPDEPGIIPPEKRFRIASTGKTGRFQILYYHSPAMDDAAQLSGLLAQGAAERRAKDA